MINAMPYVLATVVQKDPPSQDGRVALQVEFTGDVGEPAVRRENAAFYIDNIFLKADCEATCVTAYL
jgi:hypothetical protein